MSVVKQFRIPTPEMVAFKNYIVTVPTCHFLGEGSVFESIVKNPELGYDVEKDKFGFTIFIPHVPYIEHVDNGTYLSDVLARNTIIKFNSFGKFTVLTTYRFGVTWKTALTNIGFTLLYDEYISPDVGLRYTYDTVKKKIISIRNMLGLSACGSNVITNNPRKKIELKINKHINVIHYCQEQLGFEKL